MRSYQECLRCRLPEVVHRLRLLQLHSFHCGCHDHDGCHDHGRVHDGCYDPRGLHDPHGLRGHFFLHDPHGQNAHRGLRVIRCALHDFLRELRQLHVMLIAFHGRGFALLRFLLLALLYAFRRHLQYLDRQPLLLVPEAVCYLTHCLGQLCRSLMCPFDD